MRTTARTVDLAVAWLLVAGSVVHVFLAGLGVFRDATSFATHRDRGSLLELLPIVLARDAWLARGAEASGSVGPV